MRLQRTTSGVAVAAWTVATLAALVTLATVPADAAPRARVGLPSGMKAGDTVTLADGKKVSAQQMVDELNQLQEALENSGGYSLRKSDNKPFRGKQRQAGQEKEAADDKAAFAARIAKVRARQAAGFKELVRPRGTPKPSPSGPRLAGDAFELEGSALGTPLPVAKETSKSVPGAPSLVAVEKKPTDEPLAMTYEEALGKKDKGAIFVGFGLENSGDSDKVGCEGGLEAGAYLFDNKLSLVKGVLKGSVEGSTASGGLELYLIGKMVDGFPKSGSTSLPELKKSLNPPEVSFKYVWTPITIAIAAGVGGELGMTFTNTQARSSGSSKGSCTAGVVPYVRGTGHATASVAAVVYKAGVEVQLTFFDFRLPATSTIALSANPLAFREDFDVSLDTKYLDGELSFFVQTNIPRNGEKLFDVDWDTIYRKSLMSWDGFSARETLAHFSAKQTPFQ